MLQAGTSSAEELNEAHKRVDHYNAWALDAEVIRLEGVHSLAAVQAGRKACAVVSSRFLVATLVELTRSTHKSTAASRNCAARRRARC